MLKNFDLHPPGREQFLERKSPPPKSTSRSAPSYSSIAQNLTRRTKRSGKSGCEASNGMSADEKQEACSDSGDSRNLFLGALGRS